MSGYYFLIEGQLLTSSYRPGPPFGNPQPSGWYRLPGINLLANASAVPESSAIPKGFLTPHQFPVMGLTESLYRLGNLILKALPSADRQPDQRSVASEVIKYGTIGKDRFEPQKRIPPALLLQMVEKSAVVRTCVDAVIRQVTRSIEKYDRCWDFYPKNPQAEILEDSKHLAPKEFLPTEHEPLAKQSLGSDESIEQIEGDDKNIPAPSQASVPVDTSTKNIISRKEYRDLEELLLNPDRKNRKSFNQILQAFTFDLLVFDDAFISIAYDDNGKPVALYNEESETIEIRADERGNIGDHTWFCTKCEPSREYREEEVKPLYTCPLHKIPLKETAYVQKAQGKIVARWSKDEMIHAHLFRQGGRLYGSPILGSLLMSVLNLRSMDTYFSDAYTLQRTPLGMIVFTGVDQASVTKSAEKITAETSINPFSVGWVGLPEGKSVQYIEMLKSPTDMQSIEFYKLYTDQIYRAFHVTPIVGGTIESGRAGSYPHAQLDVQSDFTRDYQRCISEALTNSALFEAFGVTNWYIGFTPVEEKEELYEAETSIALANAAKAWQDAGFDVWLDPNGKPFPIGTKPKPRQPNPFEAVMGVSLPSRDSTQTGIGDTPFGAGDKPEAPASWEKGHNSDYLFRKHGTIDEFKAKAKAWYAKLLKGGPISKEDDGSIAVTALRPSERELFDSLASIYEAQIDNTLAELRRLQSDPNWTDEKAYAIINRNLANMRASFVASAEKALRRIYYQGFEDAAAEIEREAEILIRPDSADENIIDYLLNNYSGVATTLPEFTAEQASNFTQIITRAFQQSPSPSIEAIVDEMKQVSESEVWKLERIARSEVTLISNNGRMMAWRKADDTGRFQYDWMNADEACDVCSNIAAGNPWSYEDLARETEGSDGSPFRPHPNCRCTVHRHVLKAKGTKRRDARGRFLRQSA